MLTTVKERKGEERKREEGIGERKERKTGEVREWEGMGIELRGGEERGGKGRIDMRKGTGC